jgi:hypothetical protein
MPVKRTIPRMPISTQIYPITYPQFGQHASFFEMTVR